MLILLKWFNKCSNKKFVKSLVCVEKQIVFIYELYSSIVVTLFLVSIKTLLPGNVCK